MYISLQNLKGLSKIQTINNREATILYSFTRILQGSGETKFTEFDALNLPFSKTFVINSVQRNISNFVFQLVLLCKIFENNYTQFSITI